jgi:hypothetical protein
MCLNETYSKVRIGTNLSDNFFIQNGVKGDALSPLLFNISLKYALRKIQENQGTHQLLVFAVDVNLLGDNIDTIEKNTRTLIDASKEVGLEANAENSMYMLLSRHQNAGQNPDVKIANRYFENVVQFRYLGTTVKNNS